MSDRDLYGARGVLLLWFPLVAPIAAWAVHILYIASFARFSCTRPSTAWTIHVVTVLTVAVCFAAAALAWRLTRAGRSETADSPAARQLFLGRLALIVAALNIGLIILEEVYAIGFHPIRCL